MAEPLRLLCFDLDDTLWPVRPVIIRAENRLRNHLDAVAPLRKPKLKWCAIGARKRTLGFQVHQRF